MNTRTIKMNSAKIIILILAVVLNLPSCNEQQRITSAEEDASLHKAALECNTAACLEICAENQTSKVREDIRKATNSKEIAILKSELESAMSQEEKAKADYNKKSDALSQWKGSLTLKALDFEIAISRFRDSRDEATLSYRDSSWWTLDDAINRYEASRKSISP